MNSRSVASLFVLLSFVSFAQSPALKVADGLYENHFYKKAQSKYASLDLRGQLDEIALAKLATCYFYLGDYEKAEKTYRRMISHAAASSEDLFRYVHCLRIAERYSEADKWMDVFVKRNRTDLRSKEFKAHRDYLYELLKQDVYYEIYEQKVNSRGMDFGGYQIPETFDVFFVSTRRNPSYKTYNWNAIQKPIYKLYRAKVGPRYVLVVPKFADRSLNRSFEFGPMTFSQDGSRVLFTARKKVSSRWKVALTGTLPKWKIYSALINEKGEWEEIQELNLGSKAYSVGHPAFSADESKLYFVCDRQEGHGETDIYVVDLERRFKGYHCGIPTNLGTDINTEGRETHPFVDQHGNLFFSSDGHLGFGGLDLFVAYPLNDLQFKSVMNLGEPVNSSYDDYGWTMAGDRYSGHFTSNRNGYGKGDELFAFELIKNLNEQFYVNGHLTDIETENPLKDAEVILYDDQQRELRRDTTDKAGFYEFNLEIEQNYSLKYKKRGYFDTLINISSKDSLPMSGNITRDIALYDNPVITFDFDIKEKQNGAPLSNVLVHIIDKELGQELYLLRTDSSGRISELITESTFGDCLNYRIVLEKEGYLAKKFSIQYCIDSWGEIAFNRWDNLEMIRKTPGIELSELMELPPIDVREIKSDLDENTLTALKKLADVLNNNPTLRVRIEVHTDCTLSNIQGQRDTERKAKILADWVRQHTYSPSQVKFAGMGATSPLEECTCASKDNPCTSAQQQRNRRVEFRML